MEIGYAIDAEIQAKMKFNNITWRWGAINISQNKSFEYQFEFGSSTPTDVGSEQFSASPIFSKNVFEF